MALLTPKSTSRRLLPLLVPIGLLLLYACVTWIWNGIIFAAFTDFKHSLADTSVIDGARLTKQKLDIGIDPYEIVKMQLPKGQAKKLLSKNILKYCVDKSQECTKPTWQCITDYNTFGGDAQKIIPDTTKDCTDYCTATWWKVRNGMRNYIDEICVDTASDLLTYQYIET